MTTLRLISSMATKPLLADLVALYQAQAPDVLIEVESVGGVDAAKRVQAGEAFDLVILASDAIDKLIASGHLQPGSRVDLMRSGVAVAVREGAPVPDLSALDASLRELGALLENSDMAACDALSVLLQQAGAALTDTLQPLADAVDALDFAVAATLCAQLRQDPAHHKPPVAA